MNQYFSKEFLRSNKKKIIKASAILSMVVVAFFVFVLNGTENKEKPAVVPTEQETSVEGAAGEETEVRSMILVDVGGAVQTPKVAELEEGSRVADAIAAAGGLKDNADAAGINQAAFLTDGEKVYIPAVGEETASILPGGSGIAGGSVANQKVNLNTATSEELQTLSGVGPATAEKILDYRSSNGAFKTIEDLKNVSGIGDKTFEKLKEHIMV